MQESYVECISKWYGPLTTWGWAGFNRTAIHQFGVTADTGTSGGQYKLYNLPVSSEYGEVRNKQYYQIKNDLFAPFVAYITMRVSDKGTNIDFDLL